MKFIQCVQGTDEWRNLRCGVITASNFFDITSTIGGLTEQQQKYVDALKSGKSEAEAMAIAAYKSKPSAEVIKRALAGQPVSEPSDIAIRLCTDIAFERISGNPYGEPPKAWAMMRGHELEPLARQAYEERTGNLALEAGICLSDDSAFGYSTDGLIEPVEESPGVFIGCDGLIEIKCPTDSVKIVHIWRTGDISEYIYQMQGGMWITGAKWCDFIMYAPALEKAGKDIYIKRVYRDDELIIKLESELLSAHQRVLKIENFLRNN